MTTSKPDVHQELYGVSPGRELLGLLKRGAWRPILRIGGITWWTGGMFLLLITGMWATRPWPALRQRWRHRVVRRWARGLGRIVNMRVRTIGPRPRAPFFLVANHLSYVDIVLLFGELETVFVAKHELGQWPILGYLTRLVGTIFVDRQSRRDAIRVIEAIDRRIEEGDGVVVFPEGTSSDGSTVYPMKAALFEWAAQRRFPVQHAAIHYRTAPGAPPARDAVCWWGSRSFVPHVLELCQLKGFEATIRFGDDPLIGTDRSELALRAREAIEANFVIHHAHADEAR